MKRASVLQRGMRKKAAIHRREWKCCVSLMAPSTARGADPSVPCVRTPGKHATTPKYISQALSLWQPLLGMLLGGDPWQKGHAGAGGRLCIGHVPAWIYCLTSSSISVLQTSRAWCRAVLGVRRGSRAAQRAPFSSDPGGMEHVSRGAMRPSCSWRATSPC